MSSNQHITVLLREAVDALVLDPNGHYVDGTFGRGGHSREILSRLSESGRLLAFDKDPRAIESAEQLKQEDSRFDLQHDSFIEIANLGSSSDFKVDGVLLDLGVSSPQLDEAERGFSFMSDGPLDMRMNNKAGLSAEQWLATAKLDEMVRVFKQFGEERFARRIAHAIVERREEGALTRTLELASLIEEAVPVKEEGKHPATRVFQAIRIFINSELEDLKSVLEGALQVLKPGGRIVIISFHSLEDRMVKRFFKLKATRSDIPSHLPFRAEQIQSELKIIGKAIKPSKQEVESNVRSRSAIMRVAERCA